MPNPNPVVSNTTPLITLAGVGLLDLLPALYQEIWIPAAVHSEYQSGRARHPASPDLDLLNWLRIHNVTTTPSLSNALDAGEAEAIALAISSQARLRLLDEQRGRRVASQLGLPVAGSLAVLLEAKRHGHITLVGPILDQMVAQGRRISASLRSQVLGAAGE